MFFIYSNNVNADVVDKLLILQKLTTFKTSQQKQPASLNISMESVTSQYLQIRFMLPLKTCWHNYE